MEIDQPTIPGLPNYWTQQPLFGKTGFNDQLPTMGPFPKRRRIMDNWEELSLSEQVRSFKRVRILSNIKKARLRAFASWEDRMPWGVTETERVDPSACNPVSKDKSTSCCDVNAGSGNFFNGNVILSGASSFLGAESERSNRGVRSHTHEFDRDEVSDSRRDLLGSGKAAHISKEYALGCGHLAQIRAFKRDIFRPITWTPLPWFMSPSERGRNLSVKTRLPSLPSTDGHRSQDSTSDQTGQPCNRASRLNKGWLVQSHNIAKLKVPDSNDSSGLVSNTLLLGSPTAISLNARRARLLQLLPGGPILSPIPEPLCQVLDIGTSNAWPFMGKLMASI